MLGASAPGGPQVPRKKFDRKHRRRRLVRLGRLFGKEILVTRALRSQELWLTLTYLGLLLLMAKGFAS